MLFLGTEKFPVEGEYKRYLNRHGGRSNAVTWTETTNYYFKVAYDHLHGALDRFSQFFISPLFNEDATDREVNAVDSEFYKNVQSDQRRLWMLTKTMAHPKHPFSKFATGNLQTLSNEPHKGRDVRAALKQFHEAYYSGNAMKLCVVGRDDVEQLEKWVQEMFSPIVNNDRPTVFEYPVEPFSYQSLGKKYQVVPIRDIKRIVFSFPYPHFEDFKETKPDMYLSYILGYEGAGSLRKLLVEKGWAEELNAAPYFEATDFNIFRISIDLTHEGLQHLEEITSLTFQYLALISNAPPSQALFDQIAKLRSMKFRFSEKIDPASFATLVSRNLFDFEPPRVLSGPALLTKWAPEDIHELLDHYLIPRNCIFTIISKEFEKHAQERPDGWKKEKWYGTLHREVNIDPKKLRDWAHPSSIHSKLTLPPPNDLVPVDFSLRCDQESPPADAERAATDGGPGEAMVQVSARRLDEDRGGGGGGEDDFPQRFRVSTPGESGERTVEILHKMDRKFRVPKGHLYLQLTVPSSQQNPASYLLNDIFMQLLGEELNPLLYDASQAGMGCQMDFYSRGDITISVGGFSEKLPLLMTRVLQAMQSLLTEYKNVHLPPPESSREEEDDDRWEDDDDIQEGLTKGQARKQKLLERFETVRQKEKRRYENSRFAESYHLASRSVNEVLNPRGYSWDQHISFLSNPRQCNPEEMARNVQESLARGDITCFVSGNFHREEAEDTARQAADVLRIDPLLEGEEPVNRCVELPLASGTPGGRGVVVEKTSVDANQPNSAVEVHFQVGLEDLSFERDLLLDLLDQIAYRSAFNRLRTELQLGYIVDTMVRSLYGTRGFSVRVQSTVADPLALEQHIEGWLVKLRQEVVDMSDQEFLNSVNGLLAKKTQRDKRLAEESSRMWREISLRQFVFDRKEREAAVLQDNTKISKKRLLALFDEHIAKTAPSRRLLASHFWSIPHRESHDKTAEAHAQQAGDKKAGEAAAAGDGGVVLRTHDDIRQFRRTRPLHPARPLR